MAGPMPPQAAAPAEEAPAGGEDSLKGLISNISNGLGMLAEVVGEAGMPEVGQALGQMNEQFQQLVSQAMSQGGQAQQAPAGQGMAPPEVGGAKARPAGMMSR